MNDILFDDLSSIYLHRDWSYSKIEHMSDNMISTIYAFAQKNYMLK